MSSKLGGHPFFVIPKNNWRMKCLEIAVCAIILALTVWLCNMDGELKLHEVGGIIWRYNGVLDLMQPNIYDYYLHLKFKLTHVLV